MFSLAASVRVARNGPLLARSLASTHPAGSSRRSPAPSLPIPSGDAETLKAIHPLVRDLYKRYLIVSRDYPMAKERFRELTKKGFMENSHLSEEEDIIKAVARGRWYLNNELIGVIKFKKFRAMRERYSLPHHERIEKEQEEEVLREVQEIRYEMQAKN